MFIKNSATEATELFWVSKKILFVYVLRNRLKQRKGGVGPNISQLQPLVVPLLHAFK
jgi:hypothetical protein